MRASATIAFVALLALGVFTATASAAPLSMTFTESRANVGVQLADTALFAAPATAPLAAQFDPGSGLITAGDLLVPQFSTHITEPLDADVTVDFSIGVVSGAFTQATGALTLEGTAGGTLTAEGKECTVATVPSVLVLSTKGTNGGASPRSGAPFLAGLTGPGAIAGKWTDMTAEPTIPGVGVAQCETVDERIGGQGGIWLVQKDLAAPPLLPIVDPPPVCVVPKLKGKSPRGARTALAAAHCTVGKVHRPKGKKRGPLVVKSSTPPAGTVMRTDDKVDLRLGPKPRKARH